MSNFLTTQPSHMYLFCFYLRYFCLNFRRSGVWLQGRFAEGHRILGDSQTAVQGIRQATAEECQRGRSYLP